MAVPYELLAAVRAELRAWSGHWARGIAPAGRDLTHHDERMPDGSCLSCALIEELDVLLTHLDPVPPPEPARPRTRRGITTGGLFRIDRGTLVRDDGPEPTP